VHAAELSVGSVDPRVDLVGLGREWVENFVFLVGWVGSWVHKFTWQWVGLAR